MPISFVVKTSAVVVVVVCFVVGVTLDVITGDLVVVCESVLNGVKVGFFVIGQRGSSEFPGPHFNCSYDLQRGSNEPKTREIQ